MQKTVLVVDDQMGIRLLLEEVIQSEGYQVELAMNGREADEFIQKKAPDLIILDYKLPIIDGATLLKQLEDQGLMIPTIVMSGLPERAQEQVKGIKSVKKITEKPFQLDDMRQMVHSLLRE
ncbi:response regulator [Gracilibacillus halophilus YIM-C55.5]|uniref:Response regulator n=1 Tax=Gracilibacillus halophilus YIM-C55.5 TaxID=1308866 RepID=N4WRR9_9BACI|nr:response regulator [Gracilibacillus halophilus]ENH95901.1 response regulator [Gracilibacillus halophilus YIM-C55.5]